MAVNSKEQLLSLLAAANNHGDLAVKLSSLRQVKDLLLSSPSLAPDVFPFLIELHSSHHSLVRKLLLQIMEEIGLRVLEHSCTLLPVLLTLLKDEEPGIAQQSIVCGLKFFHSILEELGRQLIQHGKVERWTEEMWKLMVEFKDAVLSLIFEPVALGTRVMALKFLETCVLLFTPDSVDSDRLTFEGKEQRFNVSWLARGYPVLDPDKLISEGNMQFTFLLDLLKSSSSIPGQLTITAVN